MMKIRNMKSSTAFGAATFLLGVVLMSVHAICISVSHIRQEQMRSKVEVAQLRSGRAWAAEHRVRVRWSAHFVSPHSVADYKRFAPAGRVNKDSN